jgi:hypothetical protein
LFAGGLRRNLATKESTESEMQAQICKFLHGAADREGGRQIRKDIAVARKAAKVKQRSIQAATPTTHHHASSSDDDEFNL